MINRHNDTRISGINLQYNVLHQCAIVSFWHIAPLKELLNSKWIRSDERNITETAPSTYQWINTVTQGLNRVTPVSAISRHVAVISDRVLWSYKLQVRGKVTNYCCLYMAHTFTIQQIFVMAFLKEMDNK